MSSGKPQAVFFSLRFPGWKRLAMLIGGALIVSYCGIICAGVYIHTHPERLPHDVIPRTFNLTAEELTLTTRDGVELEAWYYPGIGRFETLPGIVLLHGLGANRSQQVALAGVLQQAGFSVIQADFRGHGTSGDAPVTFGYHEVRDAEAAIDELGRRAPGRPVGLYGLSLGGSTALLAAGGDDRVAAVVADSVYPDLESSFLRHLQLLYGNYAWLARPMLWCFELRFMVDAAAISPRVAVAQRQFAVLLISGTDDQRMPVAGARDVLAAAAGPAELWVVVGAGHGQAYSLVTEQYQQRVINFFNRYLLGPEG